MAKIITIAPAAEWKPDPELMRSLYETDVKRWERAKAEYKKKQLKKNHQPNKKTA